MKEKAPVLEVKGLTTRLQAGKNVVTAVDGVSFTLREGKTLALVGESGCGKSLTALSLLRILPTPPALPSEGKVLFQGKNLLELTEKEMRGIRGSEIAMIFQDPMSALNPVYTIGEQLAEVAEIHLGLTDESAFACVVDALEDVGIPSPAERAESYPHQLSGGMKQRVIIAMALMCEPAVLIADEPTTALDVTIQKQVLDLMRTLQKKRGTSILLITHDMGVVAEMADDVVVMYASQDVEKGTVQEVLQRKAHPYTEGLMRSLPSLHPPGSRLPVIQGTVPTLSDMPDGCYFHPRCPYVMDVCRKGVVPEFVVEEGDHLAKCWLHDPKIIGEKG